MPGILLNRLSRPREGETPEQVLQRGHDVLKGEMLPQILPDAREGVDYLYMADIGSRLDTNKDGALLDRTLKLIYAKQCDWVAVTEIARISGDGQSMFKFADACRDYRVSIYTRERLYHPYQPWRAESYRDLSTAFFMSLFEVSTYMARYERFRENALPINVRTDVNRNKLREGLGRHINGKVPRGYVWNKFTKQPEPDRSIPFPTHVAPGETTPAALTWWEIIAYARRLGLSLGVNEAATILALETGAHFEPSVLVGLWHNAFYAGRPTSTMQRLGGKIVKRPEPVYTVGEYPAMNTWAEHCALQDAIAGRRNNGAKTNGKGNWASGLVRCACGQPFISNGGYYICRGAKRDTDVRCETNRRARVGNGFDLDRHKLPDGWQRTETCGIIDKTKIHAEVEKHLRTAFARPDLAQRLAAWEAASRNKGEDRQSLYAQRDAMRDDLRKLEEQRQRAIDLAIDGTITKLDLQARRDKTDRDKAALESRLERLQAKLDAPAVAPAALQMLESVLHYQFEDLWHDADILTDHQRALLAQALLDHIPVTGIKHRRVFGAPVFSFWL